MRDDQRWSKAIIAIPHRRSWKQASSEVARRRRELRSSKSMGALPEGGLSPSDRKRVPWSPGLRGRMGTGSGFSVIFWNISPGPSLPPSWPIFIRRMVVLSGCCVGVGEESTLFVRRVSTRFCLQFGGFFSSNLGIARFNPTKQANPGNLCLPSFLFFLSD